MKFTLATKKYRTMSAKEHYNNEKPFLWESDTTQDEEGHYGKDDLIRFAESYYQKEMERKLGEAAEILTTSQEQTIERLREHLNHLYGEYADGFFGSMKHPIDTEHCKAAFKAKIKLIQKDLEQLLNTTEPKTDGWKTQGVDYPR